MNIGLATMDWSITYRDLAGLPTLGGSGWARIGLPARALASRGHTVHVGKFIKDRTTDLVGVQTWAGRALAGFDVVVMHRWMDEDVIEAVHTAREKHGQVIVNDVDDYFWGLDPRNQAAYVTDPRVNPDFNRDHYLTILRESSLVTTSTPFLAERLREMGVARVKVLRNAWSPREWTPHDVDRDPPTIGWVGALPWRSGDLEELRGVMDRFLRAHPGVHFHHGGEVPNRSAAEALGLSPENAAALTSAPLAPILEYPALWKPLDIAVIPLSPQPFNYAKSAIKGIEAAAAGVPFVATPTPEYEWLHRRGIGRLAKRPRDWLRHLEALMDPDERRREAKANREALGPLDIAERVLEYEACYEAL